VRCPTVVTVFATGQLIFIFCLMRVHNSCVMELLLSTRSYMAWLNVGRFTTKTTIHWIFIWLWGRLVWSIIYIRLRVVWTCKSFFHLGNVQKPTWAILSLSKVHLRLLSIFQLILPIHLLNGLSRKWWIFSIRNRIVRSVNKTSDVVLAFNKDFLLRAWIFFCPWLRSLRIIVCLSDMICPLKFFLLSNLIMAFIKYGIDELVW
jgi:hypothetical protein